MAGRAAWFTLGFIGAIVALALGAYVFIRAGGVPMGTSAPPLPLEQTIAQLALCDVNERLIHRLDVSRPGTERLDPAEHGACHHCTSV